MHTHLGTILLTFSLLLLGCFRSVAQSVLNQAIRMILIKHNFIPSYFPKHVNTSAFSHPIQSRSQHLSSPAETLLVDATLTRFCFLPPLLVFQLHRLYHDLQSDLVMLSESLLCLKCSFVRFLFLTSRSLVKYHLILSLMMSSTPVIFCDSVFPFRLTFPYVFHITSPDLLDMKPLLCLLSVTFND